MRPPHGMRRVALVTGAGSGLGRAIAIELGSRGWSVALVGRRVEPLAETAREIESAATTDSAPLSTGDTALVLPADVTDDGQVHLALDGVGRRAGRLDLLVHCAGFGRFESLEETSPDRFRETIAVNLTAVFSVTRAALGLLAGGDAPVIVVMNSVAGRRGYPGCAAYCASKFGLEGLVSVMREELRGRRIRVLSVFAGATGTPFWDAQPGTWDRARMMPAVDIARLVVDAAGAPHHLAVEEILVRPPGGDL